MEKLIDHFGGRYGFAEIISLDLVASVFAKERHLCLVFNPFGNYFQTQTLCHADDCRRYRCVIGVHHNIPDKGAMRSLSLLTLNCFK